MQINWVVSKVWAVKKVIGVHSFN